MNVTIRKDGKIEQLEVSYVEHDSVSGEYVLHNIDPSDTELLDGDLIWLSGSLADPQMMGYHEKFPCVYVPEEYLEKDVDIDG